MTDSARLGFLTRCAFVRSQRKHGAEAEVKWAAQGAERRARRANSASANQRPERRFQELLAAATTGRQRKWRSRRAQFQKLCLFWTAFNSTTKNLSKSLTRRGRKIRKKPEVFADLILPTVCQEFSSGAHFWERYSVKRKEKKNLKSRLVFFFFFKIWDMWRYRLELHTASWTPV